MMPSVVECLLRSDAEFQVSLVVCVVHVDMPIAENRPISGDVHWCNAKMSSARRISMPPGREINKCKPVLLLLLLLLLLLSFRCCMIGDIIPRCCFEPGLVNASKFQIHPRLYCSLSFSSPSRTQISTKQGSSLLQRSSSGVWVVVRLWRSLEVPAPTRFVGHSLWAPSSLRARRCRIDWRVAERWHVGPGTCCSTMNWACARYSY